MQKIQNAHLEKHHRILKDTDALTKEAQNLFHTHRAEEKISTPVQETTTEQKISLNPQIMEKIAAHIEQVNSVILRSESAKHVNGEEADIGFEHEITFLILPRLDGSGPTFDERVLEGLQKCYEKKSMPCDFLAMYLAISLKNDEAIPQEIRDQISVLKCQRHVFVGINDPGTGDRFIADAWPAYLKDVQKGFFGTVAAYKEFLTEHPNQYVSAESEPLKITAHAKFSDTIKGITPEMIHG